MARSTLCQLDNTAAIAVQPGLLAFVNLRLAGDNNLPFHLPMSPASLPTAASVMLAPLINPVGLVDSQVLASSRLSGQPKRGIAEILPYQMVPKQMAAENAENTGSGMG